MPPPTQTPCSCGHELETVFQQVRASHPKEDSWTIWCDKCLAIYQVAAAGDGFVLTLTPTGGLSGSFADVVNHPSIQWRLDELARLQRLQERRERDRKRRKKLKRLKKKGGKGSPQAPPDP